MTISYKQLAPIVFFVSLLHMSAFYWFFLKTDSNSKPQGDLLNTVALYIVESSSQNIMESTQTINDDIVYQDTDMANELSASEDESLQSESEQEASVIQSQDNSQVGLLGDSKLEPDYIEKVAIHLNHFKIYPARAQRRGITGEVIIYLKITQNGLLVDYQIIKSSGYQLLDNAVKSMVEKASPFPGNNSIVGDSNIIELEIPVVFTML